MVTLVVIYVGCVVPQSVTRKLNSIVQTGNSVIPNDSSIPLLVLPLTWSHILESKIQNYIRNNEKSIYLNKAEWKGCLKHGRD